MNYNSFSDFPARALLFMNSTLASTVRVRHLIVGILLMIATLAAGDEPQLVTAPLEPLGLLPAVYTEATRLNLRQLPRAFYKLPVVQITYSKPVSLNTASLRYTIVSSSEHLPENQSRITLSIAGEDWLHKQELIGLLGQNVQDIVDIKFSGFSTIRDSVIAPLIKEVFQNPNTHQQPESEAYLQVYMLKSGQKDQNADEEVEAFLDLLERANSNITYEDDSKIGFAKLDNGKFMLDTFICTCNKPKNPEDFCSAHVLIAFYIVRRGFPEGAEKVLTALINKDDHHPDEDDGAAGASLQCAQQ